MIWVTVIIVMTSVCNDLNEKCPPRLKYLNTWPPLGGTVSEDYGGESLLGKHVTESGL